MQISKVGGIIAVVNKANSQPFSQDGTISIIRRIVITYQQAGIFPIVIVTDTEEGTILSAEMPVKTTLKIVSSEPGVKGNTATNATKPATLETGVEVRVPLFINEGETIQIDTRDGSYLGRVSE